MDGLSGVERAYSCHWCGQTYTTARTYRDHPCFALHSRAFPLFWHVEGPRLRAEHRREAFRRFMREDWPRIVEELAEAWGCIRRAFDRVVEALRTMFEGIGEFLAGLQSRDERYRYWLSPWEAVGVVPEPLNVGYHAMVARRSARPQPPRNRNRRRR